MSDHNSQTEVLTVPESSREELGGVPQVGFKPDLFSNLVRRTRLPVRFVKFIVVGGCGVVVNLCVMGLILAITGYRDWRASATASVIAALHNYFLNNHWTFRDRRREGSALFSGAFLYLPMAAAGIAVTTVVYSFLTGLRVQSAAVTPAFYLLAIQLISILCGTFLTYNLNKLFTWPRASSENHKPVLGRE